MGSFDDLRRKVLCIKLTKMRFLKICDPVFLCKYHCGLSMSSSPCLNVKIPEPSHCLIASILHTGERNRIGCYCTTHDFFPSFEARMFLLLVLCKRMSMWKTVRMLLVLYNVCVCMCVCMCVCVCVCVYAPKIFAIFKLVKVVKFRTQHVLNHNWVHCGHKPFPYKERCSFLKSLKFQFFKNFQTILFEQTCISSCGSVIPERSRARYNDASKAFQ